MLNPVEIFLLAGVNEEIALVVFQAGIAFRQARERIGQPARQAFRLFRRHDGRVILRRKQPVGVQKRLNMERRRRRGLFAALLIRKPEMLVGVHVKRGVSQEREVILGGQIKPTQLIFINQAEIEIGFGDIRVGGKPAHFGNVPRMEHPFLKFFRRRAERNEFFIVLNGRRIFSPRVEHFP